MSLPNYKTKKELKSHFRKLINKIGLCNSIKTKHPEHFPEFMELFKRHHNHAEKVKGLVDVLIKNNPTFNNLELCILYEDGRCEDISYVKCVSGNIPTNNLKIAMRVSIQPQIDDFKINRKPICELCNKTTRIQVDHEIWFEKLYHDFIELNQISLPTSFDETPAHLKCFKKDDIEFETNWNKYHKENSVLRLLCSTCNKKRKHYKPSHDDLSVVDI